MRRSLKGFTLIELLVVIAIIAILAAILFPVFTNVKATGKKAACLSNMRQICSAWGMYIDNSNGVCPSLCNASARKSWEQELWPYVKNCKVFGCPASNIIPNSPLELSADFGGWSSYGWNGTLFSYADLFPVRMSDVLKPTRTVFMADTVGANWISLAQRVGGGKNDSDYKYQNNAIYWTLGNYTVGVGDDKKVMPKNCTHLSDRHNGLINVSFCDGHVGSLTEQALTAVQSGPASKIAYMDHPTSTGAWQAAWTKISSGGKYFVYFQVAATQQHF